jgi:hypothetical protein
MGPGAVGRRLRKRPGPIGGEVGADGEEADDDGEEAGNQEIDQLIERFSMTMAEAPPPPLQIPAAPYFALFCRRM